ncbi:MAG: hypothetical protein ACLFV8_14070 [Alphaproteobacteria bacterium]
MTDWATQEEALKVLRKLTKEELISLALNRSLGFRKSDLRAIERERILKREKECRDKSGRLWAEAMAHSRDGNYGLSRQAQKESDRFWDQATRLSERFMEMLS